MTTKFCEICKKHLSYKNYSHHVKTKKHANNLLKNNDKNNDKNDNINNDKNNDKNDNINNDKNRKLFTKRRTKIGADIRDSSLKLLPNPSWQKYQGEKHLKNYNYACLLYTSPSPRDGLLSRMPSSA